MSLVRRLTLALVAVLLLVGGVACAEGDDAAAGAGGGSATGDDDAGIPAGTTLRIGDQAQYVETLLRASGELDRLPFEVEFKAFLSGPLLVQGFEAGEIDAGFLGDTPASGAVPAGVPVKALGVWSADGPTVSLLARPGIDSIEELEGKKVAFTTGTAQHAVALRALDQAGLSQDDVEQVDVALQQLGAVLDGGSADASVVSAGDVLRYRAEHPDAKVLASNDTLEPPSFTYVLATTAALEDEGRSAAAYELVASLARAWEWVEDHPDEYVEAYHVGVNKQDPAFAKELFAASGRAVPHPIDDEVEAALQAMVDLLAGAGGIDEGFDVGPLFDPEVTERSNAALEARDEP